MGKDPSLSGVKPIHLQVCRAFADATETIFNARNITITLHLKGVGALTKMYAQKMGYPQRKVDAYELSGRLHDIGKMGYLDVIAEIRNHIIDPSSEQLALLRRHPETGSKFLMRVLTSLMGVNHKDALPVGFFNLVRMLGAAVRSHHERIDGTGYPDKLWPSDIPNVSGVVALADSIEAMTSAFRDWKAPLRRAAVIEEIENGIGKQFDNDIALVFIDMLKG